MSKFKILNNNQINNELLRRITEFDRTIFPLEEDHSFPDGYLERLYDKSKDGFFIMLDENGDIVGYTHSIFMSDKNMEYYLRTKDYLGLQNIGFNVGDNNLYFYSIVIDKKYRDSDVVKMLMQLFTKWLDEEKKNGKSIKNCISEAITEDGIKTLKRMGMIPQDIDEQGLGIYYSPDCLENYIKEMNQERKKVEMEERDCSLLSTEEKLASVRGDYDDIYKEYADEFFGDTSDDKSIERFLASLPGKRVLDAGCGVGSDCEFIDKRGYEAYGIDFSEGMLNEAKRRYPQGRYMQADMTNIPCSDAAFDGILANCSLFHVPQELQGKTLDGFKRVLKPGGKLLLILLEGQGEEMTEEPYRPGEKYVYTKFYTPEEIKLLLKEHGFKVEDIQTQKTTSEGELGGNKLIVFASRERILEQNITPDDHEDR